MEKILEMSVEELKTKRDESVNALNKIIANPEMSDVIKSYIDTINNCNRRIKELEK